MNGPVGMYKLKPVARFPDAVVIVDTMYRMKNIYSPTSHPALNGEIVTLPKVLEQVNKILKENPLEIEDLKKRQEAILTQLSYLKEQMLALREELSKKNSSVVSSNEVYRKLETSPIIQNVVGEPSWNGVIEEVVIHASPDHPPYSLLAVNHLWLNILRLRVSCHVHSSIPTLPPHLAVFSSLSHTPSPSLHIRLIWKHMSSDCEMVISPLSHCPIKGEVNLLRYLYRTICTPSDLITETQVDSVLDICHRLSHAHTMRDKQLMVRALSAKLGKAKWLGGNTMSIADVAAWSAVQTMSAVELSQNMTAWQARCCAAAKIEAA